MFWHCCYFVCMQFFNITLLPTIWAVHLYLKNACLKQFKEPYSYAYVSFHGYIFGTNQIVFIFYLFCDFIIIYLLH